MKGPDTPHGQWVKGPVLSWEWVKGLILLMGSGEGAGYSFIGSG